MYSRHRGLGSGYRSNAMGVPAASSPRISPESSMRGHGFYNPDYRNFNRGFGRGQSKHYQHLPPPPPPPQLLNKGDIFMEAGRLAAEYLVSKGLLPPSALPPKWPNSTFKREHQEVDNLQLLQEGRMPAHARLGNAGTDAGSSKRRFPDEYTSTGSGNNLRGRRRIDSFRNHGSDWDRENSTSGSWSDKPKMSPNKEVSDDSISVYHEAQQSSQKPHRSDLTPGNEDAGSSESYSCKLQNVDDLGSKESAPNTLEELPLETDSENTIKNSDMTSLNTVTGEVNNGSENDETVKDNASQDLSVHKGETGNFSASKRGTDLLKLCEYAKVPTRTRSSLTSRGSKVDPLTVIEVGKASDTVPPISSAASIEGSETVDKCLGSEVSYPPPSEKNVEQAKCIRSLSFPNDTLLYGQGSGKVVPTLERCTSMDSLMKENSEKQAIQHIDVEETFENPRDWFPSMVTSANDRVPPVDKVVMDLDEENVVDISLFQKGVDEPSMAYVEERQLFPSSFKICDLNLMEASDLNENQDRNDILIYPSISQTGKEASPIDVDLSMHNDYTNNISDDRGIRATISKEVEVIDLDNDSGDEDEKNYNNQERGKDSLYPSLGSFPEHTESKAEVPDAQEQDGYGLMISELLGADCSSGPADINSMHTETGLDNGEEILGDYDPIYMSLGEIPMWDKYQ